MTDSPAPAPEAPIATHQTEDPVTLAEWRIITLTYAGLVPFIGFLIGLFALDQDRFGGLMAEALQVWSALIVAFLGGTYWGVALRDVQRAPRATPMFHGMSVVAPMIALLATLLPAGAPAFILLALLFLSQLELDRQLVRMFGVIEWYWPMRIWAVALVVIMLIIAAIHDLSLA